MNDFNNMTLLMVYTMLSALNNQILHQENNNYHIQGFGNDPSRLKDIVNKFGSHKESCRIKPKPLIYQFEQVNITKNNITQVYKGIFIAFEEETSSQKKE